MDRAHGDGTAWVGREPELAEIDRLSETVLRSSGAILVLAGPLGVGKSSLLAEAGVRAGRRGFLVLAGRASPLAEGRAYALILDALRTFLRELDRTRRASLVVGLPELGRLFPGLDLPQPEPLHDPALEKTRLFEAVVRLLERLSRQQPLLLSLDDLHWADSQSLELLGHLAGSLADLRVGIVCAYRSDETPLSRSLRTLLQTLDRGGMARRLEVGRLPVSAVTDQVAALLGGPPPPALVSLLESRAGGIPLFVEGLIAALRQAGALTRGAGVWTLQPGAEVPLPAGLRDLLLNRLDRLTAPQRALVDILAVCGDATPYEILAAAVQLPEPEISGLLDLLARQQLVTETAAESMVTFELTHPLYQETAYGALPLLARRRLHLRVIEAITAQGAPDVARLGVHYLGAGPLVDGERALGVLVAAADEARAVYAHDVAARYLTAALDLVRQGRRRALLPVLLAQLGDALYGQGESGAALVLWQEAVAAREQSPTPDGGELARLCRRIGMAEFHRGRSAEALAAMGRAKAVLMRLDGGPMTKELADLCHDEVYLLVRTGDIPGAAAAAAQLAAAAGDAPAPGVLAVVLGAQQIAAVFQNRLREGVAIGRRVLACALQPLTEHRIRHFLMWSYVQLGELEAARRVCEENREFSRRVGAPALESSSITTLIILATSMGEWDEALRLAGEFFPLAQRVAPRRIPGIHLFRAMILSWRGMHAEAAEELATAEAVLISGGQPMTEYVRVAQNVRAVLAWERGDMAQLRAALATAEPLWTGDSPMVYIILAEAWALLGEPARAQAVLASLPDDSPYKAAVSALVAGVMGDPAGYARAADTYAACGLRFWSARARLGWSGLVAGTQPAQAAAAARETLAVFERLGAQLYCERTRRLLRDLGVALPVRTAAKGDGPLSPREWEVARLVAAGMSNAKIADRLFISQRTVTTHLQRIYGRLGISRSELAAYVTGRGDDT